MRRAPPTRGALLTIALAAIALAAGGCGSQEVTVRIETNPPGGTVYIDGERMGSAGNLFTLRYGSDPTQQIYVQVRKPGYLDELEAWERTEVPSPRASGERVKEFLLEPVQ